MIEVITGMPGSIIMSPSSFLQFIDLSYFVCEVDDLAIGGATLSSWAHD